MKIAVWHNLGSGGAKRALYDHIKALLIEGHHIEVWTTDLSEDHFLPLSQLVIEHRKSIKVKYQKICKINNPITKENKLFELFELHYKQCVSEIESQGYEIIFVNSCSIYYMPHIARYTKLPTILYLGEPNRRLFETMPTNIWSAPYRHFKLKKIKRYIIDYFTNYANRLRLLNELDSSKCYSKVLVNSTYSRECVLRAYNIESTVCYLGIDTKRFDNSNSNKKPYVVGIGAITYLKGVDRAIEIIGAIPEKQRPELKWIGNISDNYYLEKIKTLAIELNVNINFYINISDDELIRIVSQSSVMLYTSRLEPFGLAPLEANACGTYVIAIEEGGIKESITNHVNGTLVKNFNKTTFSKLILQYVKNPNKALNDGNNAKKHVNSEWNLDFLANNLNFELKSILQAT